MDIADLILKAGGRAQVQQLLGVARTTVIGWEKQNRIPAARVAQISETFGFRVEDVIKLASGPRAGEAAPSAGCAA